VVKKIKHLIMQNKAKSYSLLMFLFAEALIFISIIYFLKEHPYQVQFLYISVFSLVNYLIFFRMVDSISSFSENQNQGVASKGIIWTSKLFYVIFSVSLLFILTFAIRASIVTQFIIQLILLFLFFITQSLGLFSGGNANLVETKENDLFSSKNELQKIFKKIELSIPSLSNSPEITQINFTLKSIAEDLAYYSPSNDSFAKQLDQQLIILANEIQQKISNPLDSTEILRAKIHEFQLVFNSRKSIYFN